MGEFVAGATGANGRIITAADVASRAASARYANPNAYLSQTDSEGNLMYGGGWKLKPLTVAQSNSLADQFKASQAGGAAAGSTTGSTAGSTAGGTAGSTAGVSPIQGLAGSSELYRVNPATDTVAGQLDNVYANTNSPLMKRYAAQGKAEAQSRGLTNSSLAIQGGMANVLDKAGQFATTDSGYYNDRKTETLRSDTAIKTTQIGADASKYSADKGLEGQLGSAYIGAATDIKVSGMNNAAAKDRLLIDGASQREIAAADLASRERIAALDSTTQLSMRNLDIAASDRRFTSEQTAIIYSDTATGINAIDQTASAGTQNAQAQRIIDFQTIRLTAMADVNTSLGL
jgi:hypothetical protein